MPIGHLGVNVSDLARSKAYYDAPLGSVALQSGDKTPAVKELQTLLKRVGCDPGDIDGDYGDLTAAAVKKFERTHGMIQDGVADVTCIMALKAAARLRLPAQQQRKQKSQPLK
jgi:peptidoglycan hydrolase-like protein with peptidoglycan-binding domain